MPKISIIVPVYNAEKYLARCIDSILNQTFTDYEVLLVNDGSTDDSLLVCKSYVEKDSRIKLIDKENGGLSSARNVGLKQASGEYIGFVDNDDWISENFYERLYTVINQTDCDIAFCDVIRKNEKVHKVRLNLKSVQVEEEINKKLELAQFNSHRGVWNKLYKRYLFDNGLQFEEGKDYEDGLFTLQALCQCKNIVSVPDAYYFYFINPKSIVRSKPSLRMQQEKITSRIYVLNYATKQGIKIFDKKNMPLTFKFSLFGITLFTIKENQFQKRYYLFNLILFLIKNK